MEGAERQVLMHLAEFGRQALLAPSHNRPSSPCSDRSCRSWKPRCCAWPVPDGAARFGAQHRRTRCARRLRRTTRRSTYRARSTPARPGRPRQHRTRRIVRTIDQDHARFRRDRVTHALPVDPKQAPSTEYAPRAHPAVRWPARSCRSRDRTRSLHHPARTTAAIAENKRFGRT
jgi:hypothetical protein